MSREALQSLVEARAFNPTPRLEDLGDVHVPFESMCPGNSVESRLDAGARRGDRVALIADSGCGKSSVVSYALGPTAEGIAPILVPVHALEHDAGRARSVADAIIAQLRLQAQHSTAPEAAIGAVLGDQRAVTHAQSRRRGISAGFMGWLTGDLSREISQQTANHEMIPLTAKIEVIEQCLHGIRRDDLEPVLAFDDTDRWADSAHHEVVTGFFGEGIRWLAELRASIVVATHARYVQASGGSAELLAFLDTRVEIPRVPSSYELGRILEERVRVHAGGVELDSGSPLSAVMDQFAVESLFTRYEQGDSLRRVLQLSHIALVESSDAGADTIAGHHIEAAAQA